MRCLTLADEVLRRGGSVRFVAAAMPERLVGAVKAAGHAVNLLTVESSDRVDEGVDWDRTVWSEARQHADAAATLSIACAHGASSLLVDHYRLDARFEEAVGLPIVVLDDLANRRHRAALLVDHNLGRSAGDYAGLLPAGATILAGPHFAALRPAFAALRPKAIARRKAGGAPRRILLSLGSTDVGGFTAPALAATCAVFDKIPIDVVIRQDAPSRAAVDVLAAIHPAIRVHDQPADMAALMAAADLAIGAGGTTSWERCALGLPTACLILAQNQRFVAEQLAAVGVADFARTVADLSPLLQAFADDPMRLERMSAAAFAVTDGYGAARVVDQLLAAPINSTCAELRLRPATAADTERLWLWRNDPATRAASQTTGAIRWKDHVRWLAGVLADSAREVGVVEAGGKPVATVRFDRGAGGAEVSIVLDPDARRRALGWPVLDLACRDYRARHPGLSLLATIRPGNAASERIFTRSGFRRAPGLSPAGFALYVAEPAP